MRRSLIVFCTSAAILVLLANSALASNPSGYTKKIPGISKCFQVSDRIDALTGTLRGAHGTSNIWIYDYNNGCTTNLVTVVSLAMTWSDAVQGEWQYHTVLAGWQNCVPGGTASNAGMSSLTNQHPTDLLVGTVCTDDGGRAHTIALGDTLGLVTGFTITDSGLVTPYTDNDDSQPFTCC